MHSSEPECGQTHSQQERVNERADRLEDRDVRDQRLVPQELEEKGPEHDENSENDGVVQTLTSGPGLEDGQHISFFRNINDYYSSPSWPVPA